MTKKKTAEGKKDAAPKIKLGPEPYSPAWEKLANREARSSAPPIYPCGACNYPVVKGYCCSYCGCSAPYKPRAVKWPLT